MNENEKRKKVFVFFLFYCFKSKSIKKLCVSSSNFRFFLPNEPKTKNQIEKKPKNVIDGKNQRFEKQTSPKVKKKSIKVLKTRPFVKYSSYEVF